MATVEVTSPARAVVHARSRFYFGMALLMSTVVFLGFGPSFYVNAYVGAALGLPPIEALSRIIVIHGLVFTAWMLMLVIQTGLVAQSKPRWHRRLGVLGGALAAAVVVLGVLVQIASVRRDLSALGFEELPPFVRVATFGGFTSIFLFAVLMGAAIYWRNRPQFHKRLVLLATITLLGAATVRLARTLGLLVPTLSSFPFLSLVMTDLFVVALAVNDLRTLSRVHPATVCGGLAVLVMQAINNSAMPHTAIVRDFIELIAG